VVETVKSRVNGSKEGKEQAIGLAIAQIERQFGKGAMIWLVSGASSTRVGPGTRTRTTASARGRRTPRNISRSIRSSPWPLRSSCARRWD
jgi:hypothetical protein